MIAAWRTLCLIKLRRKDSVINKLHEQLEQTRAELSESRSRSREAETSNLSLNERNLHLTNRLAAVEAEADENVQKNQNLQAKLDEVETWKKGVEKEKEQVYGKKHIRELNSLGRWRTGVAYKDKFQSDINTFGKSRGLELEQLILRDEDGEQLVINAERRRTFDNLTKGEKRRVDKVLRWKDLKRISDDAYAAVKRTTGPGLPAASHIKQQERIMNERIPDVEQVDKKITHILTHIQTCKHTNTCIHKKLYKAFVFFLIGELE